MGQSLGDEIDCGNCFDHIDDLLEDLDDVPTTTSAAAFPPIWSSHSDSLLAAAGADPGFSADISLLDELSVYDNVELQWLPNLADDSLASSNQFRVSGPVSVLDSSSSSSSSESFCGERKDEPSKRAWQSSPTSSGSKVWSDSENSENGESCWPRPAKKMKNHAKLWSRLDVLNSEEARKCLHCEVRKTPQWRAGPLGPKTLCNACGVRYKSGRLYPEYRPAASPSFVPCLHSNSHKKVLEMRIKQVENGAEEEFPNRSSILV